jgi:hypothetical protein
MTRHLQGITSDQYQRCFQNLINRSECCVQSYEDYFENIQPFAVLDVIHFLRILSRYLIVLQNEVVIAETQSNETVNATHNRAFSCIQSSLS